MRSFWLIFLMLVGLSAVPVFAQDTSTADETGVSYGGKISGQINNQTPRVVYYFDGLRGEVVSISLQATGGDLDPVLTVMDTSGNIIASQDDSRGSSNITLDAVSIPQSSRYYVVIGRFGYA